MELYCHRGWMLTIAIPNKNFTADGIRLVQLLNSTTKVNMLKACDKLDLYVSPNLKKDETARRIAQEMLDNPIEILSRLNKQELLIVDEFVKGNANTYVVRKMRKTQYKLQKLFLVATYEDKESQEWHMLMPVIQSLIHQSELLFGYGKQRRQSPICQATPNDVRLRSILREQRALMFS